MKRIKLVFAALLLTVSLGGNAQTDTAELVYVMDPQCSWCYSNSGNIAEIEQALQGKMSIDLHVAGMWLGDEAPRGGADYYNNIIQHFSGLIAKTGTTIGTAYFDLASDPSYTFSSLEPAAAIILVKEMEPKKTVRFAKNVEHALFMEGKHLDELDTYLDILDKMNIDKEAFKKNWMSEDNLARTKADFQRSKNLATTYPSLLLVKDGKKKVIGVGYFTKEEVMPKLKNFLDQ